jgi:hypothetical protein
MRVPPLRASPFAVIAAFAWTLRAPVSGGRSSAQTGAGSMSFKDAQAFAYSLATSLMVVIVIFRAGDGSLSVAPSSEFDGNDEQILSEIDPFAH